MADDGGTQRRAGYGVKLVRGPFVRLAPHPQACVDDEEFLRFAAACHARGERLAADLFSGAGGLSLGLTEAGFRVVLSADRDPESVETHRHHYPGLTLDCDLGETANVERIASLMRSAGIELLAGGPPCQPFSRAGRSLIRHQVRHGLRPAHDERRDLWRSFLEVVQLARPAAVIMENVPDMALDREMFILRTMVHELESIGYAVEERVVETHRYGVPQFRQRLILVALRDGIAFDWPNEVPDRVSVWNAIGDLPEVEGGWRPEGGADGWADYQGPVSAFQKKMRQGVAPQDAGKVFDHITRPVREDDQRAFDMMDAGTRYSDLPDEFKRYRDDIFDDKYKRLSEDDYSRTITAHIAKDGYWYIHPRQDRTLTVREAARLQTFPDWFRFAGPPSAAFRQIGNAVPPALGTQLGRAVMAALDARRPAPYRSHDIAEALATWFDTLDDPALPWLRARTRWQVISAEMLLDRAAPDQVRFIWPLLARWEQPQDTVAGGIELIEMGRWIQREHRSERLLELARTIASQPDLLDDDKIDSLQGVETSVIDLAVLAVPTRGEDDAEEPVLITKGIPRVAALFTDEHPERSNRMTAGRLAVARMIGDGTNARRAHLGLVEVASSVCRPAEPACPRCPLNDACREAAVRGTRTRRSPAVSP
ncbi:DNA (cytosine-5-)-methyltransferase [Micromonospora sp. C28SCA-DRY-2]|uniref:DNA cytosine methyltransferase n=1 Tax=Micromonospora sp. C28SCA-DRY-2 TaxID=3059522 RepID=UPI0026761A41|nr:DNA cytosine methyltransferase [Micromonospora sp. C28SCA-DRY-2]MDO3704071.1 DNA (cytosine-5-)-methyltransferase [Micromonospora sp. C28SCA-DRY-2]